MITGTYINYYYHCQRHLWLLGRNITFEKTSEDVAIGKLISENTYERAKHEINIENNDHNIVIDFFDRKRKIIHEVKKSKKMEELHIWQVKYYLFVLEKIGITGVKGEIDYPKIKRKIDVELLEEDKKQIEDSICKINEILLSPSPPKVINKPYCKKCSYYEFCYC